MEEINLQEFGKIFKEIRVGHNLYLKDIACDELSIPQLSKFERGESELTLGKFIIALERLNVTFEEFMYEVNYYRDSKVIGLLKKVRKYYIEKNIKGLKFLLNDIENSFYINSKVNKLNKILIKIKLSDILNKKCYSVEEMNYLVDYLMSIDRWTKYELLIFGNTLEVFRYKTLIVLLREMLAKVDYYKELSENRRYISSILLNAFFTMVESGKIMEAHFIKKQLLNNFFEEYECFERINYYFTDSLLKIKCDNCVNKEVVISKINLIINFMDYIECHHIAETYRKELEKALSN